MFVSYCSTFNWLLVEAWKLFSVMMIFAQEYLLKTATFVEGHFDNSPSLKTVIIVQELLAKNAEKVTDQVLYSPDMALFDFFLVPKLKLPLQGRHFESVEALEENRLKSLKVIPQSTYEKCMEDWVENLHSCIWFDGSYFEGDKRNFDE